MSDQAIKEICSAAMFIAFCFLIGFVASRIKGSNKP